MNVNNTSDGEVNCPFGESLTGCDVTDVMADESGVKERTKRCKDKTCMGSDIQSEDGLLVCVNCGQVFNRSHNQFRDDPTQALSVNNNPDNHKSYVPYNRRSGNRFQVSKKYNTSSVDRLATNLCLSSDVRAEAKSRYIAIIKGTLRFATRHTKTVLSAICVYMSLANERTPITIGHICNTIGCNSTDFSKVYNQVIKDYPLYKHKQMSIESLVPVTISETKIDKEEKKILVKKVLMILELERECWLIEGRTPCHIIYAATFLAWKSINVYERRKVNFKEFCRLVDMEYKHTTSERVSELFNAIKLLATKLPTNKRLNITKTNIGVYLDEVLRYQSSLVFDFNQQIRGTGSLSTVTTTDVNPFHKSAEWMTVFKRKTNPKTSLEQMDDKRSYKSDEEISDSEINCYLRDEKEIKFIKKLKKYTDFDEKESNVEMNS